VAAALASAPGQPWAARAWAGAESQAARAAAPAARALALVWVVQQTVWAGPASASAWTGPPMESAARESESWSAAQVPPTAELQAGMALQSSPLLDRLVWQERPVSLRAGGCWEPQDEV
jgi:hypothetical protein